MKKKTKSPKFKKAKAKKSKLTKRRLKLPAIVSVDPSPFLQDFSRIMMNADEYINLPAPSTTISPMVVTCAGLRPILSYQEFVPSNSPHKDGDWVSRKVIVERDRVQVQVGEGPNDYVAIPFSDPRVVPLQPFLAAFHHYPFLRAVYKWKKTPQ